MFFRKFGDKLKSLFGGRKIDEEFFEELEDTLIEGDLGARLTDEIVTELRETARREKITEASELQKRMKEILYVKVRKCTPEDKVELFQIAETFKAKVIDYGKDSLLLEFVQTATKNDAVIKLMKEEFKSIEVVRGGSVGIESISMMER